MRLIALGLACVAAAIGALAFVVSSRSTHETPACTSASVYACGGSAYGQAGR